MKRFLTLILFVPFIVRAHPGVGIVKDSKGNIYFTDLKQVWKIVNGIRTVVVPNVHTHELHIDNNDNLYGEGGYYDEKAGKFYHYLWVYRPNGQIDTVVGMKEAYVYQDFSLARDKNGNEYYTKRFLVRHADSSHIYRKSPDGNETIFASGKFENVNWLHPQDDKSLLYVSGNSIYRVDSMGNIRLVKEQVGNAKPSFEFSGNSITIWGLWQDKAQNIYAAVFSDQAVKRIEPNGNMTEIYRSGGNWAPLHGVFDNDNKLWVLESSDKNDVRVTLCESPVTTEQSTKSRSSLLNYALVGAGVICVFLFFLKFRNANRKPES